MTGPFDVRPVRHKCYSRPGWPKVTAGVLALLFIGGCDPRGDIGALTPIAQAGMHTAEFSDDASLLLSGAIGDGLSLWAGDRSAPKYRWQHPKPATELISAALASASPRALTADFNTLVLWNTQTGRALQTWGAPGAVSHMALAPDASTAIVAVGKLAVLFNPNSGAMNQAFAHNDTINSVAISASGNAAVTASSDKTVKLWSLPDAALQRQFTFAGPVSVTAVSPDGTTVFAAVRNFELQLRNAKSDATTVLRRKNPGVTTARFNATGSQLLLGTVNRTVMLYDVRSGEIRCSWRSPMRNMWQPIGAAILSVAFDGREFQAATADGQTLALAPCEA